jgi:hypothetical protein
MLFPCIGAVFIKFHDLVIRTGEGELRKEKHSFIIVATIILVAVAVPSAWAKRKKTRSGNPDDPTYKVYQILDDSYGGKLTDYYLLADLYADPQNPSNLLQHVIRVDYDKGRFFGRFQIYVRSVGKLTPDQMTTYNVKEIYDFGESDEAEFEKINAGPLGETGDLYLKAPANGPLAPATLTDQASQEYEMLITKYLLPALQKK